jgi:hypothetical protein
VKKVLLLTVVCLLGISTTFAQKGDIAIAAQTTGLDLTLGDDYTSFDFGINGTYFATNKLGIDAGLGFAYQKLGDNDTNGFYFNVGARYYVWKNLFAGLSYQGEKYKDVDLMSYGTIKVGYDYFFNDKVFIEPILFYNIGLSDNAGDTYGLAIAFGVKF